MPLPFAGPLDLPFSTGVNVQDATTYKGNIDADMAVFARTAGMFAPHANTTPDMRVYVGPGSVFDGTTLTEVGAFTTGNLTTFTGFVTITGSTDGISGTMLVTGKGVPDGTTATISGTTANFSNTPTSAITGAVLRFSQRTAVITAPVSNPRIDRIVVDSATGAVSVIAGTEAASPVPPAITSGKLPVAQVLLQTSTTAITNDMITDERNLNGSSGLSDGSVTPAKVATTLVPYFGDAINGLGLTVNATDPSHDIDIAAGYCIDSSRGYLLNLSSALTKRLDATWAAGTAAGGLFSGSIAANTSYHVFLIRKDSDGSIDAGFDTSVTASHIPAGYTAYRCLGSIRTDGSSNILKFFQDGDLFTWDVMVADITAANPGTAAVTRTLTVPTGRTVQAVINSFVRDGTSTDIAVLLTALEQTDTAANIAGPYTYRVVNGSTGVGSGVANLRIKTNTSGQIRSRQSASGASDAFTIMTVGWYDRRAL